MKINEINLGFLNIETWKLGDKIHKDFGDWMYEKPENYEKNLKKYEFIDNKEIILEANKDYTLKITYPLSNPYETKFNTGKKGMSREEFINLACKSYHYIYDIEDKTSEIKGDLISGMYNRIKTNGDYGIWGHVLGDLMLHTLYFEEKNVITVGVDS